MSTILKIQHVAKSFGTQEVLKGIDLDVPEHSVFGFIGQNGAGKTTTMKMVLGLLKMDQGLIQVCGKDVHFGYTDPCIGYLSDVPEYYGFMSAIEYMELCARITGIEKKDAGIRINKLLQMVGLQEYPKKKLQGYSRGMKQRLGIAQALLNEPKLLICDEPTSALDPIGRKEILDILYAVKETTTVIFSTHILSDVERICDHIAILKDGNIALKGNLAQLRAQYGKGRWKVSFSTKEEAKRFGSLDCLKQDEIEVHDVDVMMHTQQTKAKEKQLLQLFLDVDLMPVRFEWEQPSLEHVFMEVVQ
ncbi:ATP-binding cassette domain-containing protein [[Eubacterium] hominis]|uniref:ABC transporter ATP-binding protein n=1 Tax=[Eubacterium] hominis TaxID=2764325 RepID=UPI003A4D57EB